MLILNILGKSNDAISFFFLFLIPFAWFNLPLSPSHSALCVCVCEREERKKCIITRNDGLFGRARMTMSAKSVANRKFFKMIKMKRICGQRDEAVPGVGSVAGCRVFAS